MSAIEAAGEALAVRAAAREIASADEVGAIFDRFARNIAAVLAGHYPVLLAVMYGGIFATVELSRRLQFPHELDYVHLSRYGKALTGGRIDWLVRPHERLRGRHVLVVDDILDKGETIAAVLEALTGIGVERVYTAVLVEKVLEVERPAADFVGLEVADAYVFGCGMDYKGFWRGLPALYAVEQA